MQQLLYSELRYLLEQALRHGVQVDDLDANNNAELGHTLGHDIQVDSNSGKNRKGLGQYLAIAEKKAPFFIEICSPYCPIFESK